MYLYLCNMCIRICMHTIYIYIYMGVDQNIVAGVVLEMTLRPPLRFLALFKVFIVFHYM